MNASLRRALDSLKSTFAAACTGDASLEDRASIDESYWSEEVNADDISPDDSVSCIGCNDAWLESVDIDDVSPEDSVSNVGERHPECHACDGAEQDALSQKCDVNGFDDVLSSGGNRNLAAHDEENTGTIKRSSHRHASWKATVGYAAQAEGVHGGGPEVGTRDLKIHCDVSEDIDMVQPEDSVSDTVFRARVESMDQRELTSNSRECVDDGPLGCSNWNLHPHMNDHLDAYEYLKGRHLSSIVLDHPEHGKVEFPSKGIDSFQPPVGREEASFGVTTTASECNQDLDTYDCEYVPATSAKTQRC